MMSKMRTPLLLITGIFLGLLFLSKGAIAQNTIPPAQVISTQKNAIFALNQWKKNKPILKSSNPYLTLNFNNVSLASALQSVAQKASVSLYYKATLLPDKHVTLHVKNMPLSKVLQKVLKGTMLKAVASGRAITLKRKEVMPVSLSMDPVLTAETVSGTVTDAQTGTPLIGVNILVVGTSMGTATDVDGHYSLTVSSLQDTLRFTYIGYQTKTVSINGQRTINVQLEAAVSSLNKVVVTALGITRHERSLPYSVTQIGGEGVEKLTKARELNLGAALVGKVAGVNASSTATGLGGSSRVIIRGNGSLSGNNQPLYVVNGIPMNTSNQGSASTYGGTDQGNGLSSINPNDIKSISVLKGGTAAALYGSRASNGVILITTKSGSNHKGLGIEYSSTYMMSRPVPPPDWQYEYGSGDLGMAPTTKAEAISDGRTSWGTKLDGSMVMQPDGVERPYVAQKNNYKYFYNTGKKFSNTLAFTGGGKNVNFRLSLSNSNNKGIVPNNSLNRKTFYFSGNGTLADKVQITTNVQYSFLKANNRPHLVDFTMNPDASVKVMANSIDVRILSPGYDKRGYEMPWNDYVFVVNPYFAVNKVKNEDKHKRFMGSLNVRYDINDFLYARARLGIDYFNIKAHSITPTGILFNPEGSMTERQKMAYETDAEALLGFNKTFNRISINALVGGERRHNVNREYDFSSGKFNIPFQYFIANGTNPTFNKVFGQLSTNSIFESLEVGFNDYLFLNMTGRTDWFSTMPIESNSVFYPSVGLSFILSDVLKSKPDWFDYAKIRAAWAQVGGGAPNPYSLNLIYTAQTSSHLGQPLTNISGNTIPNTQIKPYTSTTYEVGIETEFLNNRIGANVTIYNRTTNNDIVSASVSPATGFGSILLNVGEVNNKGIEVLLKGNPIRSMNGLNWNVSFNMAYNRNRVKRIAPGLTSLAIPGAVARTNNGYVYDFEGKPYGMVAGFKAKRDAQGNIVYNPANGIPLKSNLSALGRGVPPLTVGVSDNFTYKNFSFSFLIDGKFGSVMYTATNAYGTYYGLTKRTVANNVREDGVTVKGVDPAGNPFTKTVPAETYFRGVAFNITNNFVQNNSFIRLRQIVLGYSLSQSILSKTPFQAISLSFVARNPFLLYSPIKNVDPEATYTSLNGQGLENFGVPPTRSFGFSLHVKF